MGLKNTSVRLALCAILIGTASAWGLAPHDKAVGPRAAPTVALSSDNPEKQPQTTAEHDGAPKSAHGKIGGAAPPNSIKVGAEDNKPTPSQNPSPGDGKGFIDEATLAIAFLTFCALVVQTVIFGLQAKRLKETIVTMNKVANDQTDLSRQAIDTSVAQLALSQETGIVTDRPYYAFFTIGIRTQFVNGVFDSWHFEVIWKNFRKRSPKDLIGISSYDLREDIIPDDFEFPDKILENGPPKKHKMFIGPEVLVPGANLTVPVFEAREIAAGRKHLYVWGWSEYSDGFTSTPRRRSEFACKIEWRGLPDDPNPNGIAATRCDKHNGADEECMKPATT